MEKGARFSEGPAPRVSVCLSIWVPTMSFSETEQQSGGKISIFLQDSLHLLYN
jgi:hypothetical protein